MARGPGDAMAQRNEGTKVARRPIAKWTSEIANEGGLLKENKPR